MAGQTLVQMICKSVHANFAAMHGRFPMRSAEGVTVFASQQQHLRYVCFCAWTFKYGSLEQMHDMWTYGANTNVKEGRYTTALLSWPDRSPVP